MKIKNDTFRTYIVDDDLNTVFSKLPAGVHLEVLLDSCHSGTGTRESAALACLPREYAITQRFLIPPVDILCRQADEDDLKLQKIGRADNPQTHVLFSGCKDNQTSADAYISGAYNGAFTYYFCKTLRDAQGAITRAELLKRMRASLKHEGYDQIPQLECLAAAKKKKLLE
jgi:metacaspase-1